MQSLSRTENRLFYFLIAVAVAGCFLPTLGNGFIYDDYINLVENPGYRGLSLSHLRWMFTTFQDANYHPLTWLSYGFDYVLWGMNPTGYHLTNLICHIFNGCLYFLLFSILLNRTLPDPVDPNTVGIRFSALVGALFVAVHPLRVETVSWLATRGDLLCTFFLIPALLFYFKAVGSGTKIAKSGWFFISLVCYVCSLLSRAWGITFPLILLILDVYPLKRLSGDRWCRKPATKLLVEKIPYILFAFAGAILAVAAKRTSMVGISDHGVVERLFQSAYGLVFYPIKTLIPLRLSPFYLFDKRFDILSFHIMASMVLVCCTVATLFLLRRRWPGIVTAALCYGIMVSPLLGWVQSGPQIVANRYSYIAGLPFGVLVSAGIYRRYKDRYKKIKPLWNGMFVLFVIVISLTTLSVLSRQQMRVWHDRYSYWNYIIRFDPDNYIAYNTRGVLYKEALHRPEQARSDYDMAVRLNPEYVPAYYNRAILRSEQGDMDGAFQDYSRVIELDPNHWKAYNNRGVIYRQKGDSQRALTDFNTAIRLNPDSPDAYANRAVLWKEENETEKARADLEKAIEVAPGNWKGRIQVEKLLSEG